MNNYLLALDKASVRAIDKNGMMFVEVSNISKANVSPYLGREIPKNSELGLEPNKTYYLYRDPEELQKAAPTFNGKPILSKHIPFDVKDPPKEFIVGSIGTDASFDGTYLKNSLHFLDAPMIEAIQSGAQRELSPGYHYRADMTPGVVDGVRFDGVMRDIVCNHLAVVEVGRTGPDVTVFDELPKELMSMNEKTKKRLEALKPYLAQDADIEKVTKVISEDEEDQKGKPNGEDNDPSPKGKDNEPDPKKPKGNDEDPDEEKKKAEDEEDEGKPAMDAAQIAADTKAAMMAHFKALREAENAVRPVVGEVAMDSADEVYHYALDSMGISDHKAVSGHALKLLFNAVHKERSTLKPASTVIAQDSAARTTLGDLVPNLKK